MTAAARGLTLADLGDVRRMLLLHRTDRWYLGDFLRHASWLGWAAEHLPEAQVDAATHAAYLPLYSDDRFGLMLDVATLVPGDLTGYDLVVEPSSFRAPDLPPATIRRLLRSWDGGWELYAYGHRVAAGVKDELNYFRAAHPTSLGLPGDETCLGTMLEITDAEMNTAQRTLDRALPSGAPVVVYNPTASNAFTRETSAVKEVDNALGVGEHVRLLRSLLAGLPDHDVLIAAPLKPGDSVNARMVRDVAAAARVGDGAGRVVDGFDLAAEVMVEGGHAGLDLSSLCGFATVMAAERVCMAVGGGTGSNTHLAALCRPGGAWSLSIERGADAVMRANWAAPGTFQMGSFRWRNPAPRTAVHVMPWDTVGETALNAAARAVITHHHLAHGHVDTLFDRHRGHPAALHCWTGTGSADVQLGQALTAWMTPAATAHLGDFSDETAYLRKRFPDSSAGCARQDLAALLALGRAGGAGSDLVDQLFNDSNLYKVVSLLTASTRESVRPPRLTAGVRA